MDSTSVRFKHVSRDEGLSQAFVYSIVQDREGYMWFGTQEGLNRFDGFEFKVFVHDPENPESISGESIRTMITDSSGTLWIGTDQGGLSRYSRDTQTFTNFVHDPANPRSIADNRVRVVYEDRSGVIWVGTDGAGLDRFDRDTQSFDHFAHDPDNTDGISGASVWDITENGDGVLFVATDNGLSRLDPTTKSFVHFRHDPENPSTINDNQARVLFADADQWLWVGTASGGLNRLDIASGTFEHFVHDPLDMSSISDNRINAIFQDDGGVLWVGTPNGLNAWNPDSRTFSQYHNNTGDRYSLAHDNVTSIYQDRSNVLWVGTYNGLSRWNQASRAILHYREDASDGNSLGGNTIMSFAESPGGDIWVATFGGGLNLLERTTGQFQRLVHDPADGTSLSSDYVTSVLVDRDETLWAGTRDTGLNRLASDGKSFTNFRHDPGNPASISADGVTYILEDSKNILWVGTFGGGLNAFNPESGSFTRFQNDPDDPESLSNDRVLVIFEDSIGSIWVGTYGGGLNRFDRGTGKFTAYRANPGVTQSLSGDEIYVIQEDPWGDMWLGVKGRGLNRWRRADRELGREIFQRFTTRDGLPSSTVYGGIWDQSGNLWLSTGHGVSRLDIDALLFKNYDTSHGLQDDEFNLSAAFAASDGELFFGGVNGFNAFYPDRLGGEPLPPPVVITKFLDLDYGMSGQNTASGGGQIQLSHRQNVINFEFAAMDFVAPEKNRFKYMLEGLDEQWVDAGTKRQVTYMNLPDGDYMFRVIASNSDGVWNESGAALGFRVQPAPWMTWWAYTIYFLAFSAFAAAILRANERRVQQADKLRYAEKLGVIQARLTDAQRIAGIGNWEWNREKNELWLSDELCRLFQASPNEFAGSLDAFHNRVHPDDREQVTQAVRRALLEQAPYAIDHRIVRPDGSLRFVHERAEITFGEDGQPRGLVGTIHDITERRRAEENIERRADFQALIAKLSSDLIQAPPDDIDKQLAEGLDVVGTRYELDAISVWWFAAHRKGLRPLHRWLRKSEQRRHADLQSDQIPWIAEELAAARTIVISDVEAMPPAAAADQEVLRNRGTKSLLIIPLLVQEKFAGACVYGMTGKTRNWPAETITELQLIAENLAGAIARSRAMTRINHLKDKLQQENVYLREEVKLAHGFDEIIGESPELKRCLRAVEKVAPTNVATLILGETGTGKELIARAIHKLSDRSDKPLVSVNCPALPSTLIESELFGHEKGAFTGAHSQRLGRFELAHTGTLFLDEIGDLPLELQGKLLRVLQTGEFQRIGGSATIRVDVRLIAATNGNLKQAIDSGEFRADLYYRISSFPISLPALRNRKEDIPLLAEHFVHKHATRLGKRIEAISARMIKELVSYSWPGNVRELESTIERALISAEDHSILELHGPLRLVTALHQSKSNFSTDDTANLFAVERAHIINVLEQTEWMVGGMHGAASLLGVPESTLRSKMKKLGIVRPSQ